VHLAARTAERFGLADRGVIRPGAAADLAVVAPSDAMDAATYDDPRALARGIHDVFVGGAHVLRDGALTGARPGRGLRRSPVSTASTKGNP